ncbi:hypothetical protein ACIO3O_39285 [Streptomyces sp. NPDC087440]|uniref:hypothetical protein n=1 Tax=Streptomyces sp. NPDC087440 TaxID=3365790 RepID=UPI00382F18C0
MLRFADEHGLLVDEGEARLGGTALCPTELGYADPGRTGLTLARSLTNDSARPARRLPSGSVRAPRRRS